MNPSEGTKIYVEFSDDIREWMADNGQSVEDILEKEGIDADVEHGIIPVEKEGSRTKDVVPVIILASGGALSGVLFAVSRCMKIWLNRRIYESWEELEEIRDKDGNMLLDKKGNPQMKTVRKHFVYEPGKSDKKEKIDLDAGLKGVIMRIDSEEKQVKP